MNELFAKKNRQRKTVDPCPLCGLHRLRCICSQLHVLDLKTRVTLVIHAKELKRTTNTGQLAIHALKNSQMVVRGRKDEVVDFRSVLDPKYETYVLYPSEDARDIEDLLPREEMEPPDNDKRKPIHFIVADGNWRQASKVHVRHPELRDLPRVKISQRNLARHHLRKEHFAEGLSTLEAIALALSAVGGVDTVQPLFDLYRAKLNATLAGRPPLALGSPSHLETRR